MPVLNGGLGDVSTKRQPLPAGTYRMMITECKYPETSKNTGAIMAVVTFKVDDPEQPDMKNKRFTNWYTLVKGDGEKNEPGRVDFKKLIEAIHDEETANDPNFDTDSLLNQYVMLELSVEPGEYKGKQVENNRIEAVVRAD